MQKLFTLFLLVLGELTAETPSAIAIRNARVVTVSGPVLAHATVVLRNGLIEAVGESVAVPTDAWVVEGDGLTVYPGLIDTLSTWGIPEVSSGSAGRASSQEGPPAAAAPIGPRARGPEDRPRTESWLRAADLVNNSDRRIQSARSAGFTTAVTFPQKGIFAGQGAVVNLAGEKGSDMVVSAPAGQFIGMAFGGYGSGYPDSLMGVIAYIRQIYLDTEHYRVVKAAYAQNPRGMRRPEYDRALEGVMDSPRILLPATRRVEMQRMIRFAREIKQPAILYGGHEGYRAAGILREAGMPVLISLKWPARARDGDPDRVDSLRVLEMREKAPSTPGVLAKEGVQFAFYSDGLDAPRDLSRAVRKAIDAGLSREAAIRALTLNAAEIYGVADRLGSVEKGKIANLVVTKGDLFGDGARVQFVLIDGKKFEPAPEAPSAGSAVNGPSAASN